MVKRYVDFYTGLYTALLKDVQYSHPTIGEELARDGVRLRNLVDKRGLPTFTVDLPAMGKHLDRCLAEGEYKLSGLPGSRRFSKRTPIPKLFRGLYLLIFDEDGTLKEDANVEAIAALRQLLYCAKKASISCSPEATINEVRSFCETDDLLPQPGPWWTEEAAQGNLSLPFQGFSSELWYLRKCGQLSTFQDSATKAEIAHREVREDQSLLAMLDRIVSIVTSTLGPYRSDQWRFKHGPGAVSEKGKYENRYRFEHWPDILEHEFPSADVAYSNYACWASDAPHRVRCVGLPHSRLIAVPKTVQKPRLIAAEPSANMFCQQNIRHYMYTRVAHTWLSDFIRFRDQSQNQEMCLRGSKDGSLATIDLSAASDRVSCLCVGNVFRGNEALLRALRSTRTQKVELLKNGPIRSLNMYSTMGNATTFPVESLIFLSIAFAACLVDRRFYSHRALTESVKQLAGQVSVFGDDLIVPRDKVGKVVRLLTLLDFKVNDTKSFWTGRFRESCGVDAFGGTEVTPVYASTPFDGAPESYASCIDTSNNLYRKFWVNAANYVQSTVRGIKFPLVPIDSGVTGFQSFVNPPMAALKQRWSRDVQEVQIRVPVIRGRSETKPIRDYTALLQFFTEEPAPYTPYKGGIKRRPELKVKHRWVSSTQYPSRTNDVKIVPGLAQ
jgi:hypothetical protein